MPLSDEGIEFHRRHEGPVSLLQVVGERGSGTNFVERILTENTPLAPDPAQGWKHGFVQVPAIAPQALVVAVFRAPLPWLRSLHARPWHATPEVQALGFSDFIRSPWLSRIDQPRAQGGPHGKSMLGAPLQHDRDPLTGLPFATPMALRTAKARAHLSYRSRGCNLVLARFEAVIADPAAFVARLSAAFGLPTPEALAPIERRLGNRFRPAVASRPATPETIAPEDLAFIGANLDPALEAELGYDLEATLGQAPG